MSSSRRAPPPDRATAAPRPDTGAPLLKDGFSAATVQALCDSLLAHASDFRADTFLQVALDGFEDLALMARIRQVARALAAALPDDFERALGTVERVLGAPPAALVVGEGMAAFRSAPFLEWVALAGLDRPDVALPALARMTQHFTAEFAIRPFLQAHADITFAHVADWVGHPDARVRRLASEGTRPLLPWGRHVASLKTDPARALSLIGGLASDTSDSVRRSAANHLNDVARLDVALALAHAVQWADQGHDAARATVRHGVRNLIKGGHPEALRLIGFDVHAPVRLTRLALSARSVAIGGELTVTAQLHNDADDPVQACVDYAIGYASARGTPRSKVFKGTMARLEPGVPHALSFRRDFKPRTTRVLYPGKHTVQVRVNGVTVGEESFELT